MADEKTISVDGKFTIKIGPNIMIVSREEAETLYSELYKAIYPIKTPYYYPQIIEEKPYYVSYPHVIIHNVTTC